MFLNFTPRHVSFLGSRGYVSFNLTGPYGAIWPIPATGMSAHIHTFQTNLPFGFRFYIELHMEVSQNGWFTMEHTIQMDDLVVFQETSIW